VGNENEKMSAVSMKGNQGGERGAHKNKKGERRRIETKGFDFEHVGYKGTRSLRNRTTEAEKKN